jgi:hypothetical protein
MLNPDASYSKYSESSEKHRRRATVKIEIKEQERLSTTKISGR